MSRKIEVDWEVLFDKFKGSGKTQRQFCKENSLALSTFNKRFANQNTVIDKNKTVFIATEIPNEKSQIEIEIGKYKIVITEFNKALLLDLVEVISKLC